MGIFDGIRQAFRGKQTAAPAEQPIEPLVYEQRPKIPLSPLPKSIRKMPRAQHIDRLGMMHAKDIGFGQGFGPEQKDFWEYKEQRPNGHSKADYLEMASHIPEVRERLSNGESLESLMRDDRVGACATQYYSPDQMIKVESFPDGHYEFSSGGRHRIAAAQELGIEIPVQVNEHGNKDGYSISPWEKQERYEALSDYMNDRGYSETDSAMYEADPEWQRLYKEYDHPVNAWEATEPSGGEKDVDPLREMQFSSALDRVAPAVSPESLPVAERYAASESSAEPMKSAFEGSAASINRSQGSYADRIRHTPSVDSNRWADKRGESICAPQSDAAKQILQARGISGVQYKDGIPDFSPFSESTVKLGYMTDARHSQGITGGRDGKNTVYASFEDGELVSKSHYADKSSMADLHLKYDKPGNFEQADALTAKQWTIDGRDDRAWTAEDVAQYREEHGLTWHECNDMETMQMIPEAINADFGHFGGVGEVKKTQQIIDEALRDYDEDPMVEAEDYDAMSPEELDVASRKNGQYTDDGTWVPDEASSETVTRPIAPDAQEEAKTDIVDPDGYLVIDHTDQPKDVAEKLNEQSEQASEELQEAIPDDMTADAAPDEQAVTQMEENIPAEDMDQLEQATQELQDAMPDEPADDGISDEQAVAQMEENIPADDMDQLEHAAQELHDAMPDDVAADAAPDEQAVTQMEESIPAEDMDQLEQATQELQYAMPDETADDSTPDEHAVTQMEENIPAEDMAQLEHATQELQEAMPDDVAADAIPDEQAEEQFEDGITSDDMDQLEQETVDQEAEELAALEDVEMDADDPSDEGEYSDLADEGPEEDVGCTEDYSDLADESTEAPLDGSGFEELADESAAECPDAADYSDMADEVDTGSYDASFDSSEASFDSGDTGSFDGGGGDSIE